MYLRLHFSAPTFCISVCNFIVSLQRACSPEMGHRGEKSENIKTYSDAPVLMHKNCSPPASWFAWLSTPLTSEWYDTIWEKWWIQQLVNCISSGWGKKREQTNKEKENPQIGTAVWRGIIENASLSFIQIHCQPSQPDLKGFSIKSWTWQVMTIYSTWNVE